MSKEQVLAMIKALKDYQIFHKIEQDKKIAEILCSFIKCDKCPFKKCCFDDNFNVNFCEDTFLKVVKGVK